MEGWGLPVPVPTPVVGGGETVKVSCQDDEGGGLYVSKGDGEFKKKGLLDPRDDGEGNGEVVCPTHTTARKKREKTRCQGKHIDELIRR